MQALQHSHWLSNLLYMLLLRWRHPAGDAGVHQCQAA
jgi:hypothetical protein